MRLPLIGTTSTTSTTSRRNEITPREGPTGSLQSTCLSDVLRVGCFEGGDSLLERTGADSQVLEPASELADTITINNRLPEARNPGRHGAAE
jgi:hypothetical protein